MPDLMPGLPFYCLLLKPDDLSGRLNSMAGFTGRPKKTNLFFVCLFSVSGTALRAFTFMSLSLDLSVV